MWVNIININRLLAEHNKLKKYKALKKKTTKA